METILRGEDKVIHFVLSNENGTALDLTTLAGYIVILYYKEGGAVLKKYSKNTLSGYSGVVAVSDVDGTFDINLQSEDTKTANIGIIHAELKTQVVNAGFSSSTFHTVVRGLEIGEVSDAISKVVLSL